jgi:GT2 family glycosyltransferase
MSVQVFAIVLDWNGLEDTLACVESLQRLAIDDGDPNSQLTVVVVDNGSRQSPCESLADRYPDVVCLETGVNLGYAGGNNFGISYALDLGADFIWVLNNDAVVDPGCLATLLQTFARGARIGAVGPKVVYADRVDRIWVAWGEVTWRQSLIRLVGKDRKDRPKFSVVREVQWIPGCSILFKREALLDIGSFDADFFAYHEDVEWAARARNAEWSLWYNGNARVRHAVHGSSGGSSHYGGFRKYLSARNSVLYSKRHGSPGQRLYFAAWIVVTLPFQYLRRLLSGEQAGVRIKVRGWMDALTGRPIPLEELGLRDPKPSSD